MAKRPGWLDETPEGYIVGKSPGGATRKMGRRSAEMDARSNIVKSRMGPKGGSANLRGVRPAEYYTDPKTGATHVLMDTTKMQFDPVKQDQKALKQAIDATAPPRKKAPKKTASPVLDDDFDISFDDFADMEADIRKRFGKKK